MLELALGMAVLAVVAGALTPVAVRYVRQEASQKTAREVLAVLDAGRTFYVANSRWPADLQELRTAGLLPSGFAQSPFGLPYTAAVNGMQFQVSTTLPSELAAGVARLLPLTTTTPSGANAIVSAIATVPGANADASLLLHRQGTLMASTMLGPLEVGDNSGAGHPNLRSRGSTASNIFEGSVGVGPTAPGLDATASPTLTVSSPSRGVLELQGHRPDLGSVHGIAAYNATTRIGVIDFDNAEGADTGRITFSTKRSGGPLGAALTIRPNGNVGVGTLAPTDSLHVRGSTLLAYDSTDYYGDPGRPLTLSGGPNSGIVDLQWQGADGYRAVTRIRANGTAPASDWSYYWYVQNPWGALWPAMRLHGGTGTLYTLGSISTGGVPDLAENVLVSDPSIGPGDIVALDTTTYQAATTNLYDRLVVRKSHGRYDPDVLGIISSGPGLLLHAPRDAAATGTASPPGQQPLTLAGRIPVKVSTENGPIARGDRVVASSRSGIGMRATESGMVVGIAVETFASQDPRAVGSILALANLSFHDPDVRTTTQRRARTSAVAAGRR